MRSNGLRLGSIRGVPVYLTSGWAVIALVLVVLFAPTVQRVLGLGLVPAAVVAAGVPLLLALSVLLHELAHGLTAQRLGVTVREYVLSLWGGHTAFHSAIDRPGASALVAVVGPATNGVLAAVFWWASEAVASPAARLVLAAVAFTNVFVAVFNALPALPMDGGRLLEALVWRVRGDRDLGTLVAARVGQVVAVLVGLVSLYLGAGRGRPDWVTVIWGVLIASMLWQGASAAARLARARRGTRDVDLSQWVVPVLLVPERAPVAALPGMLAGTAPGAVVVLGDQVGRPVAWVQPDSAAAVPEAVRGTTPLSALGQHLPPEAVVVGHRGPDAVARLARAARAGARFVVLVEPGGRLLGAVDVANAVRRLPR